MGENLGRILVKEDFEEGGVGVWGVKVKVGQVDCAKVGIFGDGGVKETVDEGVGTTAVETGQETDNRSPPAVPRTRRSTSDVSFRRGPGRRRADGSRFSFTTLLRYVGREVAVCTGVRARVVATSLTSTLPFALLHWSSKGPARAGRARRVAARGGIGSQCRQKKTERRCIQQSRHRTRLPRLPVRQLHPQDPSGRGQHPRRLRALCAHDSLCVGSQGPRVSAAQAPSRRLTQHERRPLGADNGSRLGNAERAGAGARRVVGAARPGPCGRPPTWVEDDPQRYPRLTISS
jgi:hypothetical protein